MKLTIMFFLVLTLSACGGGSSGGNPPQLPDDGGETEIPSIPTITNTEFTAKNNKKFEGVLIDEEEAQGLNISVVTPASNGLFQLMPNGAFTYNAFVNYVGTDTVTLRLEKSGVSSTVTITIEVERPDVDRLLFISSLNGSTTLEPGRTSSFSVSVIDEDGLGDVSIRLYRNTGSLVRVLVYQKSNDDYNFNIDTNSLNAGFYRIQVEAFGVDGRNRNGPLIRGVRSFNITVEGENAPLVVSEISGDSSIRINETKEYSLTATDADGIRSVSARLTDSRGVTRKRLSPRRRGDTVTVEFDPSDLLPNSYKVEISITSYNGSNSGTLEQIRRTKNVTLLRYDNPTTFSNIAGDDFIGPDEVKEYRVRVNDDDGVIDAIFQIFNDENEAVRFLRPVERVSGTLFIADFKSAQLPLGEYTLRITATVVNGERRSYIDKFVEKKIQLLPYDAPIRISTLKGDSVILEGDNSKTYSTIVRDSDGVQTVNFELLDAEKNLIRSLTSTSNDDIYTSVLDTSSIAAGDYFIKVYAEGVDPGIEDLSSAERYFDLKVTGAPATEGSVKFESISEVVVKLFRRESDGSFYKLNETISDSEGLLKGEFLYHQNLLDPNRIYLIQVNEGYQDNNGQKGEPSKALLRGVFTGNDIISAGANLSVSFASEIHYERVASILYDSSASDLAIAELLNQEAQNILSQDINNDNAIDAKDIAVFDPLNNSDSLANFSSRRLTLYHDIIRRGYIPLLNASNEFSRYDIAENTAIDSLALSEDENTLYVIKGHAGIDIVDITDHSEPALIDNLYGFGDAQMALVADDGELIVAAGENGVQFLDVSDSESPSVTSSLDTPEFAKHVSLSIDKTRLYVADRSGGMVIIDRSTKSIIGTFETTGDILKVLPYKSDSKVIVGDSRNGIMILDISDLENIQVEKSLGTVRAFDFAVKPNENIAYVTERASEVNVVDLSSMAIIRTVPLRDSALALHLTTDNNLLVALSESGVERLNLKNPTDPTDEFGVRNRGTTNYVISAPNDPSIVYISDGNDGFRIAEARRILEPGPLLADNYRKDFMSTSDLSIAKEKDIAYVSNGTSGFDILDISNPYDLKHIKTQRLLTGVGDRADFAGSSDVNPTETEFKVMSSTKAYTYDLEIPTSPRFFGRGVINDENGQDASGVGVVKYSNTGKAYFATSGSGILGKNPTLTLPSGFTPLSRLGGGIASNLAIDANESFVIGTYLGFFDPAGGIIIRSLEFDNFNEGLSSTSTNGPARGVAISSDSQYAYVIADKGLHVFDISDLRNLIEVGFVEVGNGQGITITKDEKTAFVADGNQGMKMIDISDVTNPRINGVLLIPGAAFNVYLPKHENYFFSSHRLAGMNVVNYGAFTNHLD